MSYDLSIWCVEPFRDAATLPDAGAWRVEGDRWSLEGRGWILHTGGSEAVLEEDIPDEVCGVLPGIRHVVHLTLEPLGAPKSAYAALKKTAKLVSRAARGALFDPQAGTVELPSGVRRYAPPPRDEARIAVLEMSWWLDHAGLLEPPAILRFLDLLAAHAPEALPRRYGLWEPPQHELARTGREHLASFLVEHLTDHVVWYSQSPVFHVHLAMDRTCGWRRLGSRMEYRCNQISLDVDAGALDQPGWATSLRRLWRALSLELRPFFGDVRSLGGHVRKGSRIWSDSRTEPHPVRSWWWKGIPPRLGHAAVIGEPYLSAWTGLPGVAETAGGLAFVSTPDWQSEADASELVGGVPPDVSLPFMAHWGRAEHGGLTVRYPEDYPAVFPFGARPA